MGDAVTK
jgi:hypothetical protein